MASKDKTQKRRQSHSSSQKPNDNKDRDKSGDRKDDRPGSSRRSEPKPGDTDEFRTRASHEYTTGLIIETTWVMPARAEPSDTSGQGARSNIRVRRFAVIRSSSLNNPSRIYALPISTYGGLGVAKPGVVKQNHAIIYTHREYRDPPVPTSNEEPERLRDGGVGPGMLPSSVRVEPIRRNLEGYALDPMSRVNYGYIHSFENDVKVKVFGQIHQMSMQSFEMSFRHVWNHLAPYPSEHHTRRDLENSSATETPVVAESSSAATRTRNDSVTGQISTDTLAQYLENFRLSAINRGLPPPVPLTSVQQQQLAQNSALRNQYIQGLRSQYAPIAQSQSNRRGNEESSEDEDDGDDDDSSSSEE